MSGFSEFLCIRYCFLFCPFLSSWKLTRAGGQVGHRCFRPPLSLGEAWSGLCLQDVGCRLLGSLLRQDSKDTNLEFLGGCKLGAHLIYFGDYLCILYTVLVGIRKQQPQNAANLSVCCCTDSPQQVCQRRFIALRAQDAFRRCGVIDGHQTPSYITLHYITYRGDSNTLHISTYIQIEIDTNSER